MVTLSGFYLLAALALVSAGFLVTTRNLLHAVLALAVASLAVAGLMLTLGAEFLAFVLVLVYVGAVVVLGVFAVMLTGHFKKAALPASNELKVLAGAVSMALTALLSGVILTQPGLRLTALRNITVQSLGHAFADRLRAAVRTGFCAAAGGLDRRGGHRPREGTMSLSLMHYLAVSTLLFGVGLYGVFTRRNAIALLLAVELIMLAVALNFTAAANYLGTAGGQVFAVFVLTVAAAEAAVGLALVIAIYRNQQDVDLDKLTLLKW